MQTTMATAGDLVAAALAEAAQGRPVLPCLDTKAPACPHGFRDATTDPETTGRLFAAPGAALVGVATGAVSGFDVLDLDPRNGGDEWWQANAHRIPATRIHTTRSGGKHILFQHAPGMRCSAGRIAPGVDVRADGGHAIWWPAHGCEVWLDSELAPWPDWLLAAATTGSTAAAPAEAGTRSLGDIAPPSVAAVVALLDALPNPASAGRDVYQEVMLAAAGCAAATDEYEAIGAAAVRWADRWPDSPGADVESAKWESDWSHRTAPLAGWATLRRHAIRAIPGWGHAEAAAEFASVPLPPDRPAPPSPTAPAVAPFYRDESDPYAGRRWLVYQTLPERGVALLAGQSRAGKTFVAFDLALSVITGQPFAGRETDIAGGVLYLAAESGGEVSTRWKAAKAARGLGGRDLPFLWSDALPGKLLDTGAADRFTALAKAAAADLARGGHKLALIVVDTLAVASGWSDENSNAEAQRAMDVLQAVSRATGALVLAVDHHGKTVEAGTRGASAKGANADATLAVLADADSNGILSNRRVVLHKCKGAPEGGVFPFTLAGASLGEDSHGRAVTSCTVAWGGGTTEARKPLPRSQAAALDILRQMAGEGRAAEADWRAKCCDGHRISTAEGPDARGKAFRRAFAGLLDRGLVESSGGEVWIAAGAEGAEFDAVPAAPAVVAVPAGAGLVELVSAAAAGATGGDAGQTAGQIGHARPMTDLTEPAKGGG